jgi:AbgT putative transporter family.
MKSRLAFFLVILQLLIVFFSWLIAAVVPSLPIRSLLSEEGIRWFFGDYSSCLANPLLVWIILISISVNAYKVSGLHSALKKVVKREHIEFSQRYGLFIVFAELIIIVVIMLLLTIVPQAILLSANGQLFPDSSFSRSVIPVMAFSLMLFSLSFGLASGAIKGIIGIYRALTQELRYLPQVLLFYILIAQIVCSVFFVINSSFI